MKDRLKRELSVGDIVEQVVDDGDLVSHSTLGEPLTKEELEKMIEEKTK